MDRVMQALHEALTTSDQDELRELASAINAYKTGAFRTYADIKRKGAAAGKLFSAMEEALDIVFDELGWANINQPQP